MTEQTTDGAVGGVAELLLEIAPGVWISGASAIRDGKVVPPNEFRYVAPTAPIQGNAETPPSKEQGA